MAITRRVVAPPDVAPYRVTSEMERRGRQQITTYTADGKCQPNYIHHENSIWSNPFILEGHFFAKAQDFFHIEK